MRARRAGGHARPEPPLVKERGRQASATSCGRCLGTVSCCLWVLIGLLYLTWDGWLDEWRVCGYDGPNQARAVARREHACCAESHCRSAWGDSISTWICLTCDGSCVRRLTDHTKSCIILSEIPTTCCSCATYSSDSAHGVYSSTYAG